MKTMWLLETDGPISIVSTIVSVFFILQNRNFYNKLLGCKRKEKKLEKEKRVPQGTLKQNCQFPASPFIPGVQFRLYFPNVQGLQGFQKRYTFGGTVEDDHVRKYCFPLSTGVKMLAYRLILSGFVFAESGAYMSVCLTDIASLTAWTCNLVNDATGDFIGDLCFEGACKGSYFPQCNNWNNWSLDCIQRFNEFVRHRASVLNFEQVFRCGWIWGDVWIVCWFLLDCFCFDLLKCLLNYGIVKRRWILVLI